MTIDPGTSSVVASSFRSLAIFWAKFNWIFALSRCRERKRFFNGSPRIYGSFQNREDSLAHFKERFCSFLALQKVTNLFGFLSRCLFGFPWRELSFGFLPSSLPFFFSSKRFLVLLSMRSFLKFSKNLNFNPKFGRHSFSLNLFISKVICFVARVAFLFSRSQQFLLATHVSNIPSCQSTIPR